jgi:predicted DNA-binding antitoxin AbrB/MazE fold protein
MTTTVEAVYQGGVFKPVRPVDLPENQRVTVVVTAPAAGGRGVPASQVLGIAAGNGPPPDDETVRRWIEERRLQRAGP